MLPEDCAGVVPPLSRAILSHIAHDWSEFVEVLAAALALSQKSRLANALSITVNEARVALAAALLCSGQPEAAPGPEPRKDAYARSEAVRLSLLLCLHARAIETDYAVPLAAE
jgi:hypothetical protein